MHSVLGVDVALTKLPEPKKKANEVIEEVQDEFLKKKEQPTERPKTTVKITVPALAQFDSDDEDDGIEKKPKVMQKASGLFAVLPPPKGTPLSNKSFIPNILTRKPQAKPKKVTKPKPIIQNTENVESDDDEDVMKDIPETFDEETWKQVCAPNKKPQKRTITETDISYVSEARSSIEIAPEAVEPYAGLDNEAFKQLVGSVKRRKENIKLIDINEEEVLPDKDLWLTKSLTDPDMVPKEEVEDPVNDTCRRKHHITYLAQQVPIFFCTNKLNIHIFVFIGKGERTGAAKPMVTE